MKEASSPSPSVNYRMGEGVALSQFQIPLHFIIRHMDAELVLRHHLRAGDLAYNITALLEFDETAEVRGN